MINSPRAYYYTDTPSGEVDFEKLIRLIGRPIVVTVKSKALPNNEHAVRRFAGTVQSVEHFTGSSSMAGNFTLGFVGRTSIGWSGHNIISIDKLD